MEKNVEVNEHLTKQIKKVIEREINPLLALEGGQIELVGVTKGKVEVRLKGACATCPFGKLTLYNLVEKRIRAKVPGIKEVVAL
jgi:Fe-S cluster biogenesis protein NfuA